jgi:hypothetical protein
VRGCVAASRIVVMAAWPVGGYSARAMPESSLRTHAQLIDLIDFLSTRKTQAAAPF